MAPRGHSLKIGHRFGGPCDVPGTALGGVLKQPSGSLLAPGSGHWTLAVDNGHTDGSSGLLTMRAAGDGTAGRDEWPLIARRGGVETERARLAEGRLEGRL